MVSERTNIKTISGLPPAIGLNSLQTPLAPPHHQWSSRRVRNGGLQSVHNISSLPFLSPYTIPLLQHGVYVGWNGYPSGISIGYSVGPPKTAGEPLLQHLEYLFPSFSGLGVCRTVSLRVFSLPSHRCCAALSGSSAQDVRNISGPPL